MARLTSANVPDPILFLGRGAGFQRVARLVGLSRLVNVRDVVLLVHFRLDDRFLLRADKHEPDATRGGLVEGQGFLADRNVIAVPEDSSLARFELLACRKIARRKIRQC